MDSNDQEEKHRYNYPKSFLRQKTNKKIPNQNIQKCISNPLINRLTQNSIFIYDKNDFIKYFQSLKNKNLIKLSKEELIFLKQVALDLTNKNNILKGNIFISLDEYIYNKIINFDSNIKYPTDISQFLKSTIQQSKHRANIS